MNIVLVSAIASLMAYGPLGAPVDYDNAPLTKSNVAWMRNQCVNMPAPTTWENSMADINSMRLVYYKMKPASRTTEDMVCIKRQERRLADEICDILMSPSGADEFEERVVQYGPSLNRSVCKSLRR